MPPREKSGEASSSPVSAPSAEQLQELGEVMLALGATSEEVAATRASIEQDAGEFTVVAQQCQERGALPAGTYWAKGPGSVWHQESLVPPGTRMEMTAGEATKLREQITSVAPVERTSMEGRKAGTYRIVGPGAVSFHGEILTEGLVELTEEEARSILQVEPV